MRRCFTACFPHSRTRGGILVEAALVLPFFFLVLASVLGFQQILDSKLELTQALLAVGRDLAPREVDCSLEMSAQVSTVTDLVRASLTAAGVSAAEVTVTPVDSSLLANSIEAYQIGGWSVEVTAGAKCLWCSSSASLNAFNGRIQSRILIARETLGCL